MVDGGPQVGLTERLQLAEDEERRFAMVQVPHTDNGVTYELYIIIII
jgi:hypothetical protein